MSKIQGASFRFALNRDNFCSLGQRQEGTNSAGASPIRGHVKICVNVIRRFEFDYRPHHLRFIEAGV